MSLATLSSVQKRQKALHDKAKESPGYRFYALYDKVYRKDVLACAYDRCGANRGAAGVDGQEFEDIEKYGVEGWLGELAEELKSRTYQPQPVRRVMIDKPGGGKLLLVVFEMVRCQIVALLLPRNGVCRTLRGVLGKGNRNQEGNQASPLDTTNSGGSRSWIGRLSYGRSC